MTYSLKVCVETEELFLVLVKQQLHELLVADAVGAVCAANANVGIFEVLLSLDVLNLCSKGVVGFHVGVLRFALFSLSVCTYSL